MGDQDLFDEVYESNDYTMFVLESDGSSIKLKLKTKKVPGIKQSGTIWAKRKSNGNYVIDAGLGDEEYEAGDMPNPIKKLIDTSGGGPGGNAALMPEKKLVINGYLPRSYDEYKRLFTSRRYFNLRVYDKPIPENLYYEVAKLYLEEMGVPLFL